jgi:rod shape-determining protein MreD
VSRSASVWPAIASLLAALALEVLPLPAVLELWRPPFLALTIIYWCMMWPNKISIMTAFFCGLALDVLYGSLLGQNALSLSLISFLTFRFHLQIRIFPLLQLTASIFALLAINAFVQLWIDGIAGLTPVGLGRALPVVTGTLVWPFLMSALDRLRYVAENRNPSLF